MQSLRSKIVILCGLSFPAWMGALVACLVLLASGWADRLEQWSLEQRFTLRPIPDHSSPVRVVTLSGGLPTFHDGSQRDSLAVFLEQPVALPLDDRPRAVVVDIFFD